MKVALLKLTRQKGGQSVLMATKGLAGVRPQSIVAGDCTLAPDPGGCALSEGLSEEGGRRMEEGGWRKEERGRRKESVLNK